MKKSVCVDLDGVLAKYDGWKGVDYFGDPIPGAREFLQILRTKYEVIIYTCRCREGISGPEKSHLLINRVREWLDKHDMPYDDIDAGSGKPIASYYIDDRGIRCTPQLDSEAFHKVLLVVMENDYIDVK